LQPSDSVDRSSTGTAQRIASITEQRVDLAELRRAAAARFTFGESGGETPDVDIAGKREFCDVRAIEFRRSTEPTKRLTMTGKERT
jgi:hypothetical protein